MEDRVNEESTNKEKGQDTQSGIQLPGKDGILTHNSDEAQGRLVMGRGG